MKYREPAVAGSFYSDSATELRAQMAAYFQQAPTLPVVPKALIVPHAGHCYSGAIAASAYALLANAPGHFSRVVLLGPSHRVALRGCAVPSHDIFSTPLGDIVIDREHCRGLVTLGLAAELDQPHQWEHSLEVQLPFLQYCLGEFLLLPVVVGDCGPGQVRRLLAVLAELPGTLLVVSSDLSHYHSYAEANRLDGLTIERIQTFAGDLQPENACGCYALNGLLAFAREQGWQIAPVERCNSGDVLARQSGGEPNDEQGVVGYASFVLY